MFLGLVVAGRSVVLGFFREIRHMWHRVRHKEHAGLVADVYVTAEALLKMIHPAIQMGLDPDGGFLKMANFSAEAMDISKRLLDGTLSRGNLLTDQEARDMLNALALLKRWQAECDVGMAEGQALARQRFGS